jgi:hypothetical protein
VPQAQAQPYMTDFKQADANSDGQISSSEFMSACQRGMVRDTAATGGGTGTGGAGTTGTGGTGSQQR